MIAVLITGWSGLVGFHARCAVLGQNAALGFQGKDEKYSITLAPRLDNDNVDNLQSVLANTDLVLHLAGINRAEDIEVEQGNARLAQILTECLIASDSSAHVIYANSTHAELDTPYGRGKSAADAIFIGWAKETNNLYSNVILPHIYGEGGRPYYNTVTATLCKQVVDGDIPTIHEGATVELLHAGKAVDSMLQLYDEKLSGSIRLEGKSIAVSDVYNRIVSYKAQYDSNKYPDLDSEFAVTLFNTYRWFEYPDSFPRLLTLHEDARGVLFEASKGGGGGQTFLSWTKPGVERGNHYHRMKVERFLVVSGCADIKMRKLFSDEVLTFTVTGENPQAVDMPTLYTHNIINTGDVPLLTLFWTNEVFDPDQPDTYAHLVDKGLE